jgi:Fe2+ transport system protein FeoA
MEMGLLRGVVVRVAKYAPLKDPLELVVKGFHLSLRVSEARDIEVEKTRAEAV